MRRQIFTATATPFPGDKCGSNKDGHWQMNDYANRISFSHKKTSWYLYQMEETKGHIHHVLSFMWVPKTLASQEQRVGKRLWREGRRERGGSGNAIDSRYIAFFIRSLQGLWTFWTHDNYLRRWTHCSDLIGTHFVFTSDFQTISLNVCNLKT